MGSGLCTLERSLAKGELLHPGRGGNGAGKKETLPAPEYQGIFCAGLRVAFFYSVPGDRTGTVHMEGLLWRGIEFPV